MVKKQAIAAVERVGSAQPVSMYVRLAQSQLLFREAHILLCRSFDELEEYAATLCMFFNSTRSIGKSEKIGRASPLDSANEVCGLVLHSAENLIGLSAGADGGQEQVNEHKTAFNLDPVALDKLKELGTCAGVYYLCIAIHTDALRLSCCCPNALHSGLLR